MSKKIAIIDGDVMCYLSFEPRWEFNFSTHGEREYEPHPTIPGKMVPKVREYTKEENAKYLQETWARMQRKVHELVEELFCDDFLMAVQGPGNYRPILFPGYKNGRKTHRPSEMSQFVPILRKLAVQTGLALPSTGCEADDMIRWWATEARAVDQDFVIASIDKDLLCIPGQHYNIKTKEFTQVDEAAAMKLYFKQLLMGDQVDCIPGLPGIGPVKAEKELAHCVTLQDYQETVVGMYYGVHGDEWKNYLLANGKLIHIQRFENDWFDLEDWAVIQEFEA